MRTRERAPSFATPRWTMELREMLLDSYINYSIAREVSDWLQELGLPSYGTVGQQLARLRQQAASLVLPAESFSRQTIFYLSQYDPEILSEICQELHVTSEGSAETLFRRIYHEVGVREGWLRPIPEDARLIIRDALFPMLRSFGVVKDYPVNGMDDVADLFGEENAPLRPPLAYGSALIAVVIPELFQEAQAILLYDELKHRGMDLV